MNLLCGGAFIVCITDVIVKHLPADNNKHVQILFHFVILIRIIQNYSL